MSTPLRKLLAQRDYRLALADVDAARVVYFASVFRWHESSFTGWLADLGHPLGAILAGGYGLPVVSASADYRIPIGLDSAVRLDLFAGKVGRSSCEFVTEIRSEGGDSVGQVRTIHPWVRFGSDGGLVAEPLPDWLRSAVT